MDAQPRTRSVKRDARSEASQRPRGARQIVIAMTRQEYDQMWRDPVVIRQRLMEQFECCPELFPKGFDQGFTLDGMLRESKKLPGVRLRKIMLRDDSIYELRPSFALAYMVGTVEDLEKPLLALSFGLPCWVVTKLFGHSDMHWQRILERLGLRSLVGNTVRDPQKLPLDLVADEHHCDWAGEVARTSNWGGKCGMCIERRRRRSFVRGCRR